MWRDCQQRDVPIDSACRALEAAISRRWPCYGFFKVEYCLIEVTHLKTVIPHVAPRRLERARRVLDEMTKSAAPLYLPITYTDDVRQTRVAFGPLIERCEEHLFIIDGVHRSLAALNSSINVIHAAVIEAEFTPPPPGPVYNLVDINVVDGDADRL